MIDTLNETSPFEKTASNSKGGWTPNNPIKAGNTKRWGSLRSKKSINLLKAFQNADDPVKVQRELEMEQKRLTAVQEEELQRASMSQENGGEGPSPSRKASTTPVINRDRSSTLVPPRKASLGNLNAELKRVEEADGGFNAQQGERREEEVKIRRMESQRRLECRQHQEPAILLTEENSDNEQSLTPPSPLELGQNVLESSEEGQETLSSDLQRNFYSIDDEASHSFSHLHSRSHSGKERDREANSSTLVDEPSPAPSSTLLPLVNSKREDTSTARQVQPKKGSDALQIHQPRKPWDPFIPPHLREKTTRGEIERLKDTLENLAELEVSNRTRSR